MNYTEAIEKLNTPTRKDSKKLQNNTYLVRHDNYIGVKLHDTEVVKIFPDHYELYTGNWFTLTTKDRINTYSPVRVTQSKGIWYVGASLFYEGISVDDGGNVISGIREPKKVEKGAAAIKRKIRAFCQYAIKQLEKGLPLPSGGDCWYCLFTDKDGKTMGDLSRADHLLQHMADKYVVPSLIVNAVKEKGYISPPVIIGYDEDTKKMGGKYCSKDSVYNALYGYMLKRLMPR